MTQTCFITGGSSQIGTWLVPDLVSQGWSIHLISRGARPQNDYGPRARWHTFDLLNRESKLPDVNARVLFHTASISALLPWLKAFSQKGVTRVIAFSSTSRFTKVKSENAHEQEVVDELRRSESALINECEKLGIAWTIFRPTLIYGGKLGDRNVMDIARVIKKLGFFPVFGDGKGHRQPVHAADLAKACILACNEDSTFNRAYNLSGGEILPYTKMVERIFSAMNQRPRFVRIPLWIFGLAVRVANLHPSYRHLTSSMAKRMQQDMVFPHTEARNDFAYAPRAFRPELPERRLLPDDQLNSQHLKS